MRIKEENENNNEKIDNWLNVIKWNKTREEKEKEKEEIEKKRRKKNNKKEKEKTKKEKGRKRKCHCKKPCALNNHDVCNTPNCRMKMLLINYPKLEKLHGEKIEYEEWMTTIKTLKAQVQDETSTVHLCVLETVILLSMYALADYINHVTPVQLRKAYYQFIDILNLFSSHSIINELKNRYKKRNTPLARLATIWIEAHIEDNLEEALKKVKEELKKKGQEIEQEDDDDEEEEEEEEELESRDYVFENLTRPNEHQLICFLYFTRGYIYDQLESTKQAYGDYTRSLEYNTQATVTRTHRGRLLFDNEQFEEAKIDLTKAVALDKEYIPALLKLGQLYEDPYEERGKAIDIYDQVLKIEPEHIYAKAYRSTLIYEVAKRTASLVTL